MKKSILFFSIIATLFLATSCQQDTSVPELKVEAKKVVQVQYLGPRNAEELKSVLASSKDEVINSLSESTKESLIKNMVFKDGMFRGMKARDENIQKLYDTNILKVLSALLQMDVVERNQPEKTNYRVVFGSRLESVGNVKYQKVVVASHCSNCKIPVVESAGSSCCEVGGDGCDDYRLSGEEY